MSSRTGTKRGRALFVITIAIACAAASGSAQSRRRAPRPPSVAQARAEFVSAVEAAEELVALDVQPGDQNGQVRAWDQRWARRLQASFRRIERLKGGCPLMRSEMSCRVHEACELLIDNPAFMVQTARQNLYGPAGEHFPARAHLALYLAAHRIVADMAAGRDAEGLACEDLPESHALSELGLPDDAYTADGRDMIRIAREGRGEAPSSPHR